MSDVLHRSGRQLASVGSGLGAGVGAVTGSSVSPWGVLVGALLLVLLYLLLSRANLTAKATGGVLNAARWLVAPTPLPF